jgi:hypothetical protein
MYYYCLQLKQVLKSDTSNTGFDTRTTATKTAADSYADTINGAIAIRIILLGQLPEKKKM